MPKLLLLFSILFWLLAHESFAQYVEEKNPRKDTTIYVNQSKAKETIPSSTKKGFDVDKLVPGGNFALSFGNPTFIDISPRLGYLLTETVVLGLGATYMSYRFNSFGYNFYGGQLWGRVQVFENIYANAELDFLNVPDLYNNSDGSRRWLTSPLIGASYVVPFGSRGGLQATVLYNLNYQQAYSPYASPIIWRIGFFL